MIKLSLGMEGKTLPVLFALVALPVKQSIYIVGGKKDWKNICQNGIGIS